MEELQGQGQSVLAPNTHSEVLASPSLFVPLFPHQKNGDKEFPPGRVVGRIRPHQTYEEPTVGLVCAK